MGTNWDTPLVKSLMVGSVALAALVAFIGGAQAQAPKASFADSAQVLLAGRTDAQLNDIGAHLCGLYKDGQSTKDVVNYLIRGGASEDSADQIARLALVYKCPELLAKNNP